MIHFKRSVFQGVLLIGTLFLGGKASLTPLWAMEGEKEIALDYMQSPSQEYFASYYEKINPKTYLPKTWKEARKWTPWGLSNLDLTEQSKREDFLRAYNWSNRKKKTEKNLLPTLSLSWGEKDLKNLENNIKEFAMNSAKDLKGSLDRNETPDRNALSEQISQLFPSQEGFSPIQEIFSREDSQKRTSYLETTQRLNLVLPIFIDHKGSLEKELTDFNKAYNDVARRKKITKPYHKKVKETLKKGFIIQQTMFAGSFIGASSLFLSTLIGTHYYLDGGPTMIALKIFPNEGPNSMFKYLAVIPFYAAEKLLFLSLSGLLGYAGARIGSYGGFRLATMGDKN